MLVSQDCLTLKNMNVNHRVIIVIIKDCVSVIITLQHCLCYCQSGVWKDHEAINLFGVYYNSVT